jgi:acyl transferase domain-containing protein/phosphopantetheinyl transferase
MACVFPGAENLNRFWRNLACGTDAISRLPVDRWPGSRNVDLPPDHGAYIGCRRGGFVPTPYHFDPARHKVMPNVAAHGDPDQFILLDILADALDDAGIGPDDPRRQRTDLVVGRGGYTSNKMMEIFLRADGFERVLDFLKKRFVGLDGKELDRLASEMRATLPQYDVDGLASSIPNLVPSRAANRLDLQGSAYTVDAACASSLIAVEDGMRRLRDGRCDLAIAAGISFVHVPSFWYLFTRILAMSPTEQIRPFDRRADGMLIGEGAGAVVLKRVEDALRDKDRVYAVVRGAGSASDGRSVGVLAPSSQGQVRALEQAYRDAGEIDPDTIGFLEAHGTGTPAGDLVEIETIKSFFGPRKARQAFRTMGSVKSMVGHLMPAAGMASFIKTALALSNKILPPSLHCEQPHPALGEIDFYVSGETRPWLHPPGTPRRAGINAFGFGGINAHLVLEEVVAAPRRAAGAGPKKKSEGAHVLTPRPIRSGVDRPSELLSFSAPDRAALAGRLRQVARFLRNDRAPFTLEDLAWTLGRDANAHRACRLGLVASTLDGLAEHLEGLAERLEKESLATWEPEGLFYEENGAASNGHVAAVFPGIAFPGLVGEFPRHLLTNCLQFPVVREVFDQVEGRDGHPGDPIPTSYLLLPPAHLDQEERAALQSRFAPPPMVVGEEAITVSQLPPDERNLSHMGMLVNNWASWQILRELKIPVDMLCGQSLGDVSAVLAAGMADFEEQVPKFWEAFNLEIPYRATGLVAMVGAEEERVAPFMEEWPEVSIGLHLSPTTLVLGGPEADIRALCKRLRKERILAQTLPFPAIHTPQLIEVERQFAEALHGNESTLRKGNTTIYSGSLAAPIPSEPKAVEDFLRTNITSPVRFWQTVHRMYDDGARFVVQIGSGTLAANSRSVLNKEDAVCVAMDVGHRDPITQLQFMCGQLYAHGLDFDQGGLFPSRQPEALPLAEPRAAPSPPRTAVPITFYWAPLHSVEDAAQERVVEEPAAPEPEAEEATKLPFLGKVAAYEAGRQIRVESEITLEEHRYLEDHALGNAMGHKPLEECFPILPLTMTLELIAEVAACLAPGLGLVGFEKVRASRRIGFEGNDRFDLRTEGKVIRSDADGIAVRTEVYLGEDLAARADAIFAPHYRETVKIAFSELRNPKPFPAGIRDLYETRFLFHGPRFQCVTSLGPRGENGIVGELKVLDHTELFASTRNPQLLVDPIALDGAGQILGSFFLELEGYVLPLAVDRIEFYRPSPPPGTTIPVRVEHTEIDLDMRRTSSNIEVQDGQGNVWFRAQGWQDVIFRWKRAVLDNQRDPEHHSVAAPLDLPGMPSDGVAVHLARDELNEVPPDWVARNYLDAEEFETFRELGTVLKRQRDWLLGRIAAKDAVRLWLARRSGDDRFIHPVLIRLDNDEEGRVRVVMVKGYDHVPHLSLGHGEGGAVAAVSRRALGIDAEEAGAAAKLDARDFSTPSELAQIDAVRPRDQEETAWLTRLWCAKEAAAKASGLGLKGGPRAWEAVEVAADGHFTVLHHDTAQQFEVQATRLGELVVAVATWAQTTPKRT